MIDLLMLIVSMLCAFGGAVIVGYAALWWVKDTLLPYWRME